MKTSAEQKVIDAIDALGVPYELIAIDPAWDGERVGGKRGIPGEKQIPFLFR